MACFTAVKRSIGVATLLLLAACSSTKDKDDQPAKLAKFDAEVAIKREWRVNVGSADNKYLAGPRPVVRDGVIYAAAGNGRITAVKADSGKRLWKARVNKGLSGGVGLGNSQLYVGDTEGRLFAFNAADGIQQWQVGLGGEILSAPAGGNNRVAVQTKDGWVYMLDASTGEEQWKYRIQNEETTLTNNGTSAPVLAKGMVIAASANGKVYAVDAERGSTRWERQVSSPRGSTELEKLSDIDGEMILDSDILYVTSYQGSVMALSRSSGVPLWDQTSSSIHGPAIAGSRLIVVEDRDYVVARRSNGGAPLWENNKFKLRGLTAPITVGDYVAVADNSGYLHIISAEDGRIVGRKKVNGSGVRVPMSTDGKLLYVQDHGGTLTAFRIVAKK